VRGIDNPNIYTVGTTARARGPFSHTLSYRCRVPWLHGACVVLGLGSWGGRYVLPPEEARRLPPPPRNQADNLLVPGSGLGPSRLLGVRGAPTGLRGSRSIARPLDEGLAETAPQVYPCRVDKCGAAVPRRYPAKP
jgi:hypothetical protein